MSYNPHRRDSSWTEVQPGCFIDPMGYAHIFPDEILAYLQAVHPQAGFDPNSRADYELVVKTYEDMLRRNDPNVKIKIIGHDRDLH